VFEDIINKIGLMPLPHYIKEELKDKERYQTVYSRISGSAAAPTAGLQFTKPRLEKIKEREAEIAEVLLHVGLGTFRPVSSENIEELKAAQRILRGQREYGADNKQGKGLKTEGL
jgi:S-adenosylmethionine:tRNA ribosyltransferase-isomerase